MEKNIIALDEAKGRINNYDYALVYRISEVCLGKTSDIEDPWEEMMEARFFSDDGELHIFQCEKEWKAVELLDCGNDANTRTRRYNLANKFRSIGNILKVKDYLDVDKDGQVYVAYTRLCGIEGGSSNGKK